MVACRLSNITMAAFEIIETGFDSADETINFGNRSIANDSLYEISTIACLRSSEDMVSSSYCEFTDVLKDLSFQEY